MFGGVVIAAATKKSKCVDVKPPKLNFGDVEYCWLEDGKHVMTVINNILLNKCGEFGKELLKFNNDKVHLTSDSSISIIGQLVE